MADIHIGRMNRTGENERSVELHYHIPLDAPVSGIIPTPESVIEWQLEEPEVTALADGSLVEVTKRVAVPDGLSQSEIMDKIKADWSDTKVGYNKRYDFKYRFYGTTLSAT